jgi:uncharacterized protein (DUF924 family)
MMIEAATEILLFWFGEPSKTEYGTPRKVWFQKDETFDAVLCDRFLIWYERSADGSLQDWQEESHACLALILLLDQFPRNCFRNTPQAFATDPLARTVANYGISQGYDQILLPAQRWFFYLPFEHSESMADQRRSLQLWEQLRSDPASLSAIDFAYRHADVIQRFGRFPHRNKILGRVNTLEEVEFLKQADSRF